MGHGMRWWTRSDGPRKPLNMRCEQAISSISNIATLARHMTKRRYPVASSQQMLNTLHAEFQNGDRPKTIVTPDYNRSI